MTSLDWDYSETKAELEGQIDDFNNQVEELRGILLDSIWLDDLTDEENKEEDRIPVDIVEKIENELDEYRDIDLDSLSKVIEEHSDQLGVHKSRIDEIISYLESLVDEIEPLREEVSRLLWAEDDTMNEDDYAEPNTDD